MGIYRSLVRNSEGFTLIEIAIVMVIVGFLVGAGVSLFGVHTERKARNDAIDYLRQSEEALLSFVNINGRLPNADTNGDGQEDAATFGTLPYVTLGLKPRDAWSRLLRYEVNAGLVTNRVTTCNTLRTGLGSNPPQVEDADANPGTGPYSVAAILVSGGPMDADSDGNEFDRITAGPYQGDNTDGTPNYIRNPPITSFDDLVLYLGAHELYGNTCEYPSFTVTNNFGAPVYVHDQTQGIDLPGGNPLNNGGTCLFNVVSGTQVQIHLFPGGVGAPIGTTPATPIILAGHGWMLITVP